MGLRTPEEYLEGLKDTREVYYQGEQVTSVPDHPELGIAARHSVIDFRLAEDPSFRELAVDEDDGEAYSAYYRIPRTGDDLLVRSQLIEAATAEGATQVVLVKEIGTDALFALRRVLTRFELDDGLERLDRFHRMCRDQDATLAVAQTDVKGDRGRRPSKQDDEDLYLRVVERRSDGIVVRGAKSHTSCAPYSDHLIVLPSRSMTADDADWSMAFTIPVATPGLRMYASDFMHGTDDPFRHPISSRHKMIESLTVFDDVFVPWENVFFHDEPGPAGEAALAFVEYHRFTAVSYKLPLLDAFVGAAIAVAEANGIMHASHVRDKLTWLAGYAEEVRALIHTAALRAKTEVGIAFPDVFTTNLAKWVFARSYHVAVEMVQDLAGGSVVTGPGGADWDSPLVRPVLEKYYRGAWPANQRLAILNLIGDLTARQYAGWQAVLAVHAEGSIEAEKLAIFRSYEPERVVGYARSLAGLD